MVEDNYVPTERQRLLMKIGQAYVLNDELNNLIHLLSRTESIFRLFTEYEEFEKSELNKKLNELYCKAEEAKSIVNLIIHEEMDKEQSNEST